MATHATARGGCFASLVIGRAGFAIQASTSHVSDMKAQLPMLTLMDVARVLALLEAVCTDRG